jgi:two-component system chemotaxis sensor kinase CheA
MSGDNADFISEFVAESREHLDTADACLLRLAKDAADADSVQACFRALHTIKGGAGFMGLDRIQSLAHAAEQLLDAVREKRLTATPPVCDALLASVSRLREHIEAVGGGGEAEGDDRELVDRLHHLLPAANADEYSPSAHSPPAEAPQSATSRRVRRSDQGQPPPATSIDEVLGELIALDLGDAAAVAACLDRLAASVADLGGDAAIAGDIASLRQLAASGADPARRSAVAEQLLQLAERFAARVVSARLRRSAGPAAAQAAQAAAAGGGPSIADFLSETTELLASAEAALLASAAPDLTQIQELFRAFHTVKGMAAYLGHPRIEQLAHAIESRFIAVRDGSEPFTGEHRQLALGGIDALRALGGDLQRRGSDAGPWPRPAAVMAETLGLPVESAPGSSSEIAAVIDVPRLGDLLVETGVVRREVVEQAAAKLKPGERLGEKLIETGAVKREVVEQAVAKQAEIAKNQGDGFARVPIHRLEELVNIVGELLIAQAMVAQEPEVQGSPRLSATVGRQARVVRDLQDLSLSLRLVPLRATFQKMARAVHDTARKLGKQVDFQVVGDDVEVDRTLAEAIADPLLHMVRNAVDHGVEDAAGRSAAGKPVAGTVRLIAAHSGDHVVVQLTDDGKGLDPAKLTTKAKEKGLIAPDAVLSDAEAFDLIFLPGFSTAAAVTAVSGRGVGMDVVKRNIERVKGRVEISSTVGKGSTFTIRLPLTTAILDAMVLRAGEDRFLVPVPSVVEAIRPRTGEVSEILGRGRVIQARGQLVPVVHLGETFGLAAESDPTRSVLLVLEREGGPFALQVDEILGLQQVVIKPLGEQDHHPGVAGCAIMGDGRVGLILDPPRIVN